MGHGPLVPNAVDPGSGPASTGPASAGPPSPASAGPCFDGSTLIGLPGPFAQAAPSSATATIRTANFPTTPSPHPGTRSRWISLRAAGQRWRGHSLDRPLGAADVRAEMPEFPEQIHFRQEEAPFHR